MDILVTGSSGHLGAALVRKLDRDRVVGLDAVASQTTSHCGTITDRRFVAEALRGVDAVIHTATLHKPHVGTHSRQDFVDVNITGTLNLLEQARAAGVSAFVFTSTTSAFGAALTPPTDAPAAWIDEDVASVPKNVYGVTKVAAEDFCELFARRFELPCVVLRTSRFFPEPDDRSAIRDSYVDDNVKANEFLYRRVDLEDVVDAHLLALARAPELGFGRYIVSATTPFTRADLTALRRDAPAVVAGYVPGFADEYARRGWRMFPAIERVYDNARARVELGWTPRYDFATVVESLRAGADFRSPTARAIGSKGYHTATFADGPYPVDQDGR